MPNLLTIDHVSSSVIEAILNKADLYKKDVLLQHKKASHLANRVAANLFFETSTRTLNSFILAECSQNMTQLSPNLAQSALKKGESIEDTLMTLQAMGVEVFVIRSKEANLINELAQLPIGAHMMNAGIGCEAHPTQALIDLSVIKKYVKEISDAKIAIVGDLKHSRVARSQIKLFNKMGIEDIRLIAPEALQMNDEQLTYQNFEDMEQGLKDVDVIIRLRLQKERLPDSLVLNYDHFKQQYLITAERLALAKPGAILMHPGPCIIDEDIESGLMKHPKNVILEQVSHSVSIRMACLDYVFGCL